MNRPAPWPWALCTLASVSGCDPRVTTIGALGTTDVSRDASVDAPPSAVLDASL